MAQATVEASATIHAPASRVYEIIADYRQHHPRIVPPEYFRKIDVEEGGVGAGTRTRIEMRVLGTTRELVHVIREPEPGRVLEEVDTKGLSTTTFTVDPADHGASARVSIETRFVVRGGLLGLAERLVLTSLLRRIYKKELVRIESYAASSDFLL
jgi:Polyketide cyclase / dehydrase and lipid transport